jgi:hypothetical protein
MNNEGKDVEGSGREVIYGAVSAFGWRNGENPLNTSGKMADTVWGGGG